jgi:hypothetical protein
MNNGTTDTASVSAEEKKKLVSLDDSDDPKKLSKARKWLAVLVICSAASELLFILDEFTC